MPRFVIQEHHSDRDSEHHKRKTRHFDIMLEKDGVLKTWSLEKLPGTYRSRLSSQPIKSLPDHRMTYLTYQGKISRGRGTVKIWDKGVYQNVIWKDNFKVLAVQGQKITGYFIILSLLPRLRLLPLIRFQQTRHIPRGKLKSPPQSGPKVLSASTSPHHNYHLKEAGDS